MHELERIARDAYLEVYGDDAIAVGGATCLRAPLAPDSPMLNRIVGLGAIGDRRGRARQGAGRHGRHDVLRGGLPVGRPSPGPGARGTRPRAGLGVDALRAQRRARVAGRDLAHDRRGRCRTHGDLGADRGDWLRVARGLSPGHHRGAVAPGLGRLPRARRRRARRGRCGLDTGSGRVLRVRGHAPPAPGEGRPGRAVREADRAGARGGVPDARHRDRRAPRRSSERLLPEHPALRVRGAVRRRTPPAAAITI